MDNLRHGKTSIIRIPFSEVKDYVNTIYQENAALSCYQSYDFLNITGKGFTDKSPLSILLWSELTYVQFRGEKVIAVVPLLRRGNKELKLRGAFTSAGLLDILYRSDWSYEEFAELFAFIQRDNAGAVFRVDRLPEKSLFLEYAKRHWSIDIALQKCVTIPIQASFDVWYKSLSRSVRQNYRTSLNRLNTDKLQYSVKAYWNQAMDRKRYKETTRLYCQRLAEHNTKKRWMQKMMVLPLRFMKTINPMSRTFQQMSNCFDVELYIQDELAAVCCGYLSRTKRAIVPRFFINTKFSRYSPGGILIAEIIKTLSVNTSTGVDQIDQLDLSRGAEKYKYDYGGTEYYIYGFEVRI